MIFNKVFIIAEAGVNHNGSFDSALKLVDKAKESGADCVKFQTFEKAENVISKHAKKADYQKETTGQNENQLDMVKKLRLSFDEFKKIKQYCDKKEIMFLSTPFDIESIEFLAPLVPVFKIPSGEITNLPYLRKINSYKKDVILSTGMANLEEIKEALNLLKDCKVTLLQCSTEYPCPYEEVNMNAMIKMREYFNLPVGYSDHTQGIAIPIMAAAMGAKIIEKHIKIWKAPTTKQV